MSKSDTTDPRVALVARAMADRPCTCHPSEAPAPCPKKYASGDCVKASKITTVPCPVTGNTECKEPMCRLKGCYLESLRVGADWSEDEIRDLMDEVSDVE